MKCSRVSKETSVTSGQGARERAIGDKGQGVTGADGGESWGAIEGLSAEE